MSRRKQSKPLKVQDDDDNADDNKKTLQTSTDPTNKHNSMQTENGNLIFIIKKFVYFRTPFYTL